MADAFGTGADVFYGDPEKPLPDWRTTLPPEDPDGDDVPTAGERAALVATLGFDPAELWEDEDEE